MDHANSPAFRTEIEFTLVKGFIDESGVRHRRGTMRLATAAYEILPLRDPRVQANPAYLTIIVLARVITRLGSLPDVDTQVVEGLFAADLEQLRRLLPTFAVILFVVMSYNILWHLNQGYYTGWKHLDAPKMAFLFLPVLLTYFAMIPREPMSTCTRLATFVLPTDRKSVV